MHYVCQNCNQARATVHITETMPEKHERHLCDECAEKEGVIVKQHHPTNTILQEFIKHKAGIGGGEDHTCPECGLTFREFQQTGQFGCPNDYEVFREHLEPLMERAHESATRHVGKVPHTADEVLKRQSGLTRLKRELQEAIADENYELAARVRDEIRAMQSADAPESS